MDTLTHIVLGACIGEAIAGKQLGKKAIILGAIAQNIPDIDFVASFWLPTATDVLAHRGFTHSLLFALLVTPLLAYFSVRLFRSGGLSIAKWSLFWGLQILVHIFIDAFNVYGTGWFEPFSHYRVSFNTMFVADPLFSIWPAVVTVLLLLARTGIRRRMTWVKIALGLSALYMVAGIAFKFSIDRSLENGLTKKGIFTEGYFTTPTPLNNLLWYIVAKNDSGYYIGYRSVLDKAVGIDMHFVRKNDSLLKTQGNREDIDKLLRFSQGYYATELWHDTVVFDDLRFGEMYGCGNTRRPFVFHYFLQYPEDNKVIVQRGRFAGWNEEVLTAFLRRIKGI